MYVCVYGVFIFHNLFKNGSLTYVNMCVYAYKHTHNDIVPIHKGGEKTDPLNYRPVSLTSVVSKICEILIKGKWVRYLEDNKVISNRLFGFRQGKSCVTNLLSFYTQVIEGLKTEMGG